MTDKKYIEDFYKEWQGKSIAVVGNAKFNKKVGKEIDSHDIVIRFNFCITKGYTGYVGKKTTVACVGSFTLFDAEPDFKNNYDIVFSHYPKDRYIDKGRVSKLYLPREFYWDTMKIKIGCRKPTTGFRMLYSLYKNLVKADVYGFDFYNTTTYYAKNAVNIYDFFDEHDVSVVDRVHNQDGEKKYWANNKWFNFKDF